MVAVDVNKNLNMGVMSDGCNDVLIHSLSNDFPSYFIKDTKDTKLVYLSSYHIVVHRHIPTCGSTKDNIPASSANASDSEAGELTGMTFKTQVFSVNCKLMAEISHTTFSFHVMKFSNDMTMIFAGASDGCVYVYETATLKLLITLECHQPVQSLAMNDT